MFFNNNDFDFLIRGNLKDGNTSDYLQIIYNTYANESVDYVAMHYDGFIKNNLYKNAESLQRKYLKDIEKFKRLLQSMKKNNYNAHYYDSAYDIKMDELYSKKERFGDLFDRNGDLTKNIKDMEDNPEKYKEKYQKEKEKFLQDMLYIEKNAVTNFTQFVNEWTALENFRLRYVNAFVGSFNRHAKKAITEDIYLEYKKKYPKEFADVEDPYPEYA